MSSLRSSAAPPAAIIASRAYQQQAAARLFSRYETCSLSTRSKTGGRVVSSSLRKTGSLPLDRGRSKPGSLRCI
jgi:hypothetical protein